MTTLNTNSADFQAHYTEVKKAHPEMSVLSLLSVVPPSYL